MSRTHENTPHLVIRPSRGWGRLELRELWRYRELTWFLTWRNIKARYRQMALGPLWILIKPVINAVLFSIVFGRLAGLPSQEIPYLLFAYTALLPWTYFADAVRRSSGSLVEQMQVISKVYFPRLVVPLSAAISGLVDLAISFLVLGVMLAYYRFVPSWQVVYLPAFILMGLAAALAIGLWTATLSVKYRDVQFAITHGIQIGMYATPVVYSVEVVPAHWMWLYTLNPMFWVVEGFRWSLLGGGTPPEPYMLVSVGLVAVVLVSGAFVFKRTERSIVDLL